MPTTNTTKKYVCKTECFYLGRLWKEGTFVEFRDNVEVPHHFEEIVPPKVEAPKVEEPKAQKKKAPPKKTKE